MGRPRDEVDGVAKASPLQSLIALDDQFLTSEEAANLIKMSSSWLKQRRMQRQGPPYRQIKRSVRYSKRELLEWWGAYRTN